jgi:membrane protein implicated in regulation of membrane protease activity
VETWQIVMYAIGAVLLVLYFKRRSDRLKKGQ